MAGTTGATSDDLARILVVDDNDDIRVLLKMTLGSGFDLIEARDGLEALDLLQRGERVDAVITDVRQPGIDGVELTRRIRRETPNPSVPVIVWSAAVDRRHAGEQDALEAGADLVLPKDIDLHELMECLDRLLEH